MESMVHYCKMSKDEIYQMLFRASDSGSYISYIRGSRCQTEEAFFYEISASFQFPWYFGENWAALDECMCDLDWLKFESIVIAIDDFQMMFCEDASLQTLLVKYLTIMVDYWKSRNIPVCVWINN